MAGGTVTIPSVVKHKGRQYRVTAIDLPDGSYYAPDYNLTWKWQPSPGNYYWVGKSRPTVVLSEGGDTIYNMFPVDYVTDLWLPKTFRYLGYLALTYPGYYYDKNPSLEKSTGYGYTRIHVGSMEDWLSIDYAPRNEDSDGSPLGRYDLFIGSEPLEDAVIPQGITELRQHAFSGAYIQTVRIHGGVRKIGNNAFSMCTWLRSVELPQSLEEIGEDAFARCDSLSDVRMPNGLKRIDRRAFELCGFLKSITIPPGVESIGNGAFSYCDKLENIYCLATIPLRINSFWDIFSGSKIKRIFVPAGAVEAYKSDEEWGKCQIVPIEEARQKARALPR